MSNAKRKDLAGTGRGAVGKTAVVGAKDRATNKVNAKVVTETDKPTLHDFVADNAEPDAVVYTDDASAYEGSPTREAALQRVAAFEARLSEPPEGCGEVPDFSALADDLEAAWEAPGTTMRARQQLLRSVIEDIVADVDEAAREVVLVIHWRGNMDGTRSFASASRQAAALFVARPKMRSR